MTTGALEGWIARLEKQPLPALPGTWPLLQRLCADENVRLERLADVIERDPGLTLHFLRAANRLEHRHLSAEVKTVNHALMMLGLDRLQRLAAQVPRLDWKGQVLSRDGLLRAYGRAFHAAYQAWDWSRLRQDIEPGEVACAALLHSLGEMLLWLHAPETMREVLHHRGHRGMEPQEAEYVLLGFSLEQLSLALAQQWRLPTLLQHSLQAHHAENRRVWGVILAVRLATQVERGWYRREIDELLASIAEHLGWSVAKTATRLHRNAASVARLSDTSVVAHPAAYLLAPVRAEDYRLEQAEEVDFCLTPRPDILNETRDALRSQGAKAGLRQAIERALDGMHRGIGLNRVAFAAVSPDRGLLRPVSTVWPEHDAAFGRLSIALDEDNLFSRLLKQPQALWMNDDNRGELWPSVPEAFRRTVRTYSFFAMSIFAKGRPLGVFYADRHSCACRLDASAYEHFKQLALLTAKAIEAMGAPARGSRD